MGVARCADGGERLPRHYLQKTLEEDEHGHRARPLGASSTSSRVEPHLQDPQ
jgi:hypothetical protein